MRRSITTITGVAVMAILVAAGGCSDATGPDDQAVFEAGVDGAGGEPRAQGSRHPGEATSTESDASTTAAVAGTVDITARVFVQASTGEWHEITSGAARQRVRIDGSDGLKLLGSTALQAGHYTAVRIEFEEIEADVSGGLYYDLGWLTGRLSVDSGADGKIVIEREVAFMAESGSRTRIRIAVGANEWLEEAQPGATVISETAFRSAVGIHVE